MNSYSENLQKTVSTTLNSLYADQQKIASEQRSAEYNLYFAQGAQISSGDNLANTNIQLAAAQGLNDQGVTCDNTAINLLGTATTLQSNTTTAISNVAAAAANIKAASNSISKVAANIGSALNIALASCYDTDIYKKTQQANDFISVTANEAEYASQLAMEASSQCSELMSADVLSNVTASKTALEQLLTELSTDVTNLSSQSTKDFQTFNSDKKAERKAEGVLKDADSQLLGVNESVFAANSQLNLNVNWLLDPVKAKIQVFSSVYESPFVVNAKGSNAEMQVVENQYVFFAKASNQSSITLEQVETLFSEYYTSANSNHTNRFYLMASEVAPIIIHGAELGNSAQCSYLPTDADAVRDSDGDLVVAGQDYVAFIYVELTLAYQRFIGVYDNIISSASASFTPTLALPVINSSSVSGKDIQVTLEAASSEVETNVDTELHVMLLPKDKPDERGLMTSSPSSVLPFYFNVSVAQQVSSANYLPAEADFKNANLNVSVSITDDTTDNFGSPLIKDIEYYIGVLCLPHSAQNLTQYLPTLYITNSPVTFDGNHLNAPQISFSNVTHVNNTKHTPLICSAAVQPSALGLSAQAKEEPSTAEEKTAESSDTSATDSKDAAKKSNKGNK
ncbi:hypothetical protein HG263_06975 [Pseudoalteromonas sp. JBTF-M23]|uniref:Uncharacterized protein n=1 Tax=Pseudoalteromonas caenipelagi TaxID=2726988 RepID=A0A849VCJ7_9GAMM|nr:hypothetical protein [Pseudoalteromonas caenipelagi]NOU50283.1 hypothetical protein [Pseudoalteromonas caenipelagi]